MSEEKEKPKRRIIDVNVKHTYENPEKTEKTKPDYSGKVDPRNVRIEGKTLAEILEERDLSEKEAEELRAKFEAIATAEYEKDKKAIINRLVTSGRFDEEELEGEIEPSNIETYRKLAQKFGQEWDEEDESKPPKRAVSGAISLSSEKAIPTLPSGVEYEDERDMVRKLYVTAYYDRSVTPKERERARRKIKTLWRTLQPRLEEAMLEGKEPEFNVWMCSHDGTGLWGKEQPIEVIGAKCPICGNVERGTRGKR